MHAAKPMLEQRTAKRITIAILGAGLAAAVWAFCVAAPAADTALGYDPLTNKRYLRELQMYGGKANVASAEFLDWFNGLWHGRTLAYTLAVLTVIVAWLFWFFSTLPAIDINDDAEAQRLKAEAADRERRER